MASYIQAAGGMVSDVLGSVKARVAGAVTTAQSAKGAGMAHVASFRAFATSTIEGIKKKGMRTWSAEVARALQIAAGAQAQLLQMTTQKLLSDVGEKTRRGAWVARGRTIDLSNTAKKVASQKSFQATAGSAVGGAVAMGVGGGATGLATGGAIGAAVGVPFAFFTFGLSIPIGAVIGGGTGLVAGAAMGASTGAVGGGAVGYGAYTKRNEIAGAAKYVQGKASEGTTFVQSKASEGASFVKCKASGGVVQLKGAALQSAEYASGVASAAKSRVVGKAELQKMKAN